MKVKILYLYAELMGYQMPLFDRYVNDFNAELLVVHDVLGKESKFELHNIYNSKFVDKDSITFKDLNKLINNFDPDIVYVSGWMYFDYLRLIYSLKKRNKIIVTGFDDIWHGTIKQRIASLFFPFIKQFLFSCAWVAGPYQFEFAARLGFKKSEIIFNCLSADTDKFEKKYFECKDLKSSTYPKNFLFVGRFNEIKGIDLLIKSWDLIYEKRNDWTLTLIGNGPLFDTLNGNNNIKVIDFLQPSDLVNCLDKYGCIIIPSRSEQWSVTMHEFAAAGFPLICSDICGAIPLFLIPNFNGFLFKSDDCLDLSDKLLKIINLSDDLLNKFSANSHLLGSRIDSDIAAASFLSLLNLDNFEK